MGMLKLLYLVGFNVGESMVTSDNSAIVRAGHINFLGDNPLLRGTSHKNLQAFWNINFQYQNSDEIFPFLTLYTGTNIFQVKALSVSLKLQKFGKNCRRLTELK